jgi:hypothetical protein
MFLWYIIFAVILWFQYTYGADKFISYDKSSMLL